MSQKVIIVLFNNRYSNNLHQKKIKLAYKNKIKDNININIQYLNLFHKVK